MKTYTIIGGVNGTGKSSLTGVLKTQTTDLGQIIDVDKITAENGGSAIQGGKIALERIRACLDKGISFTQETTLSGRKTELTAQEARERGYSVRLFYVGLDSAEECLQRIENRVAHGGHDIREEDVLRRFAGRWEAVTKVLPYCDEAHFFDNYNGFVEVAEYVNGELIVKGNKLPAWIQEFRQFLQTARIYQETDRKRIGERPEGSHCQSVRSVPLPALSTSPSVASAEFRGYTGLGPELKPSVEQSGS